MQSDLNLPGTSAPRHTPGSGDDADFERAKGVIDSVIKPLIAIDFEGKILEITPVAAMLLKGNPGSLKGTYISAVLPELSGDIGRIATPGLTTVARRGDGSQMPVRLTAMRVCTDYLEGWLIFLQPRKAPSLQDGLAHISSAAPTTFDLS